MNGHCDFPRCKRVVDYPDVDVYSCEDEEMNEPVTVDLCTKHYNYAMNYRCPQHDTGQSS